MESYNSTVEPSSFVNILTLRYDPSIRPNLPKKTWKDFVAFKEKPKMALFKNTKSKVSKKYW